MECQPQNPEIRNNPENFQPCIKCIKAAKVFVSETKHLLGVVFAFIY